MNLTLESTAEYLYDGKGQLSEVICKNGNGDEYCITEYTYDCEGKILSESVTYSGKTEQTIFYGYDNEGRLISKSYPDSSGLGTINYLYDSKGNCTAVKQDSKLIRETVYDGFGRVVYFKDYDKPGSSSFVETNYRYDDHGRSVSMITENDGNASDMLESFTYIYDKNGSIESMTHINDLPDEGKRINETRDYVYDTHGNLIKSTRTDHLKSNSKTTTEYEYDPAGNRKSMTESGAETKYTYNGLNQLQNITAGDTKISYSYDSRGNQIEERTEIVGSEEDSDAGTVSQIIQNTYTVTGEMTGLTKTESGTVTLTQINVYNHNGQRISRTQDGNERSYYYDSGVVVFTEDGNDISSTNVLSPEGTVVGSFRGTAYHNYLTDMQGSTTSIIKEDGTLSAAYDYTDFGETTEITGSSFDNQICYTGGIYDKETELYYLNARYYDPEIGRFISQDSYRGELNDPGQWHLYTYCANNPINYIDPSGHKRFGSSIITESVSLNSEKKGGIIIYAKGLIWKRHKKTKKIKVTCVPGVYAKCDRPSYALIHDLYISYYNTWESKVTLKIVYRHYRPKLVPTDSISENARDMLISTPTKMVIFKITLKGGANSKSKVYSKKTYTCKPQEYRLNKF